MPVVQVLGTRSEYPGRDIAIREGDLDFLEDLPFDRPFEPGSDRLLFGIPDEANLPLEPQDDEYWLAHPLAEGADTLYRFRSGDTLTLSFADGRRLRAIQLDVLAREADAHRISGALWIEPESGALVRAVYRLSREFDAMRDIPDLEREEERGTFRFVPGLVKPWTFDLTMIAVSYSLWDFKAWLPHSMRVEGKAAAGIIKIPVSMDISYQIESVTLAEDEQPDIAEDSTQPFTPPLEEVHFKTRAEAMAFIAELLSEDEDVDYEALGADAPGLVNSSWMIAPKERHLVAESPHLPPPVWKDAVGFPSDAELERFAEKLADLPAPSIAQAAFGFHWGWARPDLIRYNRVEGPAFGGRLEWAVGQRFSLGTSGFFGLADLRPKVRLDLQRSTMLRRLSLGAFHELRPTDPAGRYLDFGNSLNAFLFGRDNGEYYRATGADLTWRPPEGERESFTFRAYAERQGSVGNEIDFALFRAFDGDGTFRPNIKADHVDEAGAELRLSPWWGSDPGSVQLGIDLHGRWAMWRVPGEDPRTDYQQASATLRAIIPSRAMAGAGGTSGSRQRPEPLGATHPCSAPGSWAAGVHCVDTRPPSSRARPSRGAGSRCRASSKPGPRSSSATSAGPGIEAPSTETTFSTGSDWGAASWTASSAWTSRTDSKARTGASASTCTWTRFCSLAFPTPRAAARACPLPLACVSRVHGRQCCTDRPPAHGTGFMTTPLRTAAFAFAALTTAAPLPAQTPARTDIAEPFKVGTFEIGGEARVGMVLRDALIVDIGAANQALERDARYPRIPMPGDMVDLIARYEYGVKPRLYEIVNHLAAHDMIDGATRPGYIHAVDEGPHPAPHHVPGQDHERGGELLQPRQRDRHPRGSAPRPAGSAGRTAASPISS